MNVNGIMHTPHIYAYIGSKTHTEYNMISRLEKDFDDTSPEIWIDTQYIPSSLIVPKGERFGLSGQKRVQIWNDFWKHDDALSVEVEKRFPSIAWDTNWWQNATKAERDEFTKIDQAGKEKYEKHLMKKYKITQEQLDEIISEGYDKKWPYPIIEKANDG